MHHNKVAVYTDIICMVDKIRQGIYFFPIIQGKQTQGNQIR
jgi:hypothetical protein